MLRVQGDIINVIRYKVKANAFDTEMTMHATTLEEAEELKKAFNGEIEEINTKDIEWIDGVIIPETDTPMEVAMEILHMGEQGYNNYLIRQEKMKAENLLAENEMLKQQILETQVALVSLFESGL